MAFQLSVGVDGIEYKAVTTVNMTDSGVEVDLPSKAEREKVNITTALSTEKKLEWEGVYLGEGSFGKVIKVKHQTDECNYAVKLMPCIPGKREKYQQRELKLLTKQVTSPTIHKNIVKYYDSWYCTVTNRPFLCIQMELCDISLETLLQQQKSVVDNPLFYWKIFPQILHGLKYLHDHHWVHRDIYPSNILLAIPENVGEPIHLRVVKIADFGLARMLDQSSLTVSDPPEEVLSAVGNKLYRAPEMRPKENSGSSAGSDTEDTEPMELNYDFKVDLYSAGLVLYRMCRYFENGLVITSELRSIQHDGLVDKSKLAHHDEFLDQLLDDLLKENPVERLSASAALACFENCPSPVMHDTQVAASPELSAVHHETDGPRIPKIMARKSSSSSYVRVHSPHARSYDAMLTFLVKDLEIDGIECFNIIEESDKDCRQKIKNNRDWETLLSSANRRNCQVKLVVEPKSEEKPDLC